MHKLSICNAIDRKTDVLDEILRGTGSQYTQRLYAILLACHEYTPIKIGLLLKKSPRTVTNWIHTFNEFGLDGLKNKNRSGRKCKITDQIMLRIRADINKSPSHFGYKDSNWDGVLLSNHLEQMYEVELGMRQSQRLLKKLGFIKRRIKE